MQCNIEKRNEREPQSDVIGAVAGLDSTSAAQVVDILASLAHRGVNVVLSIHQPRPDVLRLMDSLIFLSLIHI